jgi:hypothetical protein
MLHQIVETGMEMAILIRLVAELLKTAMIVMQPLIPELKRTATTALIMTVTP